VKKIHTASFREEEKEFAALIRWELLWYVL
jgi:hypothetical protein